MQKTGAIIAAGGLGQRMGGTDKMFALIRREPLLARVVEVFQQSDSISQIVLVLNRSNLEQGRQLVSERGWSKVSDICLGGVRRQDSVKNGLSYLKNCEWVIIHDGARPFVTKELIEQGLEAAAETGAAVAATPINDTVKLADESRIIRETLKRENIWAVQTPQVFRFAIISEAYRHAHGDVTDDAMLVEQTGCKVKLYMGSYDNIKVTTTTDLALVGLLWRKYEK